MCIVLRPILLDNAFALKLVRIKQEIDKSAASNTTIATNQVGIESTARF